MRTLKMPSGKQSGFTLVETLMAILILSGGLLALASGFAEGTIIMMSSHPHQVAKEKASEAIESVFTSRDTRIIAWARIRNVSEGGIFLDGPKPLLGKGPDGLSNTADDETQECETLPGPDNVLDTEDDVTVSLAGFTREVEITDISANLRQIRVIISYQVGHLNRQYELISYISSFA